MKLHAGFAVVAATVMAVGFAAMAGAQQASVAICHRDDDGAYVLLEVSQPAAGAHTKHGDALPGDPIGDMPGYVFDESCAPLATDDDGDGVPNNLDLCPGTPDADAVDSDGCSFSQLHTVELITGSGQTLPNAALGHYYSEFVLLLIDGVPAGDVTWSIACCLPLPVGIAFDTATGEFAGTPSELGDFPFTLVATIPSGEAFEFQLTLSVVLPPP